MVPETGYAETADGLHIADQVFGEGRVDLVLASWALNVDTSGGGNRTPTRSAASLRSPGCSRSTVGEPVRPTTSPTGAISSRSKRGWTISEP